MARSKDQKLEMLKRIPLFANLSWPEIKRIGELTDEVDVSDGKVLTREGQSGREFYVIIDGQARVERNDQTLRIMQSGDFFGEIALIDGGPRTATVVAQGPVRLLVLNRREFQELLREFPNIQIKVLQALAQRVRHIEPEQAH